MGCLECPCKKKARNMNEIKEIKKKKSKKQNI